MSSRVLFEVDPDAVDVEHLAVPSGTGSNVAAEQCGRGGPDGVHARRGSLPRTGCAKAIGCAIRSAGLSVGVAVEFFRDRRPVDGRGVEGREFVGRVHPVRVRRGVAARGSEDNGGRAKPDGYVAERRCCSEKLDGSHAVVPPPVQQHQHDRNAGGDQGALPGGRLDDAAGAGDLRPHDLAAAPGGQSCGFTDVVEVVAPPMQTCGTAPLPCQARVPAASTKRSPRRSRKPRGLPLCQVPPLERADGSDT
jgi:hypothetical protein